MRMTAGLVYLNMKHRGKPHADGVIRTRLGLRLQFEGIQARAGRY